MKNWNIVFAFCFLIGSIIFNQPTHSQTNTKEFVISPRIGSEIDKNERVYFNLFPKIKNFISAKVFESAGEGCTIIVKYDSLNMTKIIEYFLNNDEISNIKTAIENYEYIDVTSYNSKSLNINWTKILGFIRPAVRYYPEESVLTVVDKNKLEYSGKLMWADSNIIILIPENEDFKWNKSEYDYKIFHYYEIEQLKSFWNRTFSGEKSIYLYNLNELMKMASFLNKAGSIILPPPPEILSIIQKELSKISSNKHKTFEETIKSSYSKFHVSLGIIPNTYYQLYKNITNQFVHDSSYWFENTWGGHWYKNTDVISDVQDNGFNAIVPEITADYSINDKLRIGVGFSYFQSDKSVMSKNYLFHQVSAGRIIIEYQLNRYLPFSLYAADKFETSVTLGFLYCDATSTLNIDEIRYSGSEVIKKIHKEILFKNLLFGGTASFNISYFLTELLSLNTALFANYLVPKKFEMNENFNKTSSKDKLIYSGTGFKFRLGVHF